MLPRKLRAIADWQRVNTIARYYILASIAEHLHKELDNLEYVLEIIQTLDGMFAKSNSTARQAAIWALMNTRMTGGSVRDHFLKMMVAHISTTEVMGAKIKQEMKIDMILESLPDRFSQFKMNYNMNKLNLTPVELMHKLASAKGLSGSKEVPIMLKVPQNLKGNLTVERRTRSKREQVQLPNQLQ
ncbi:uncharacterized protein LOC125421568 [Ziziphus jujuba]|uniref:Uncharacterized protein LOC125421568 n=1 Tax=Ziziphus jujuba TaxID=326968 RepID=A0ABM3IEM2_ZIZJJ|nr:uncharacterized protein LOC125421568 [Ziziphus jujuba]